MAARQLARRQFARRWWRTGPLGRDERGAVAAELVVATPLLLLLILGVVQFALLEHAAHVAEAVAQQGLAVGRLDGATAADGAAEAKAVLGQLGTGLLVAPVVTATRTNAVTTVTVTGHVESVLGIFSLPVSATAAGTTEAFTGPSGQEP